MMKTWVRVTGMEQQERKGKTLSPALGGHLDVVGKRQCSGGTSGSELVGDTWVTGVSTRSRDGRIQRSPQRRYLGSEIFGN